MFRFFLPRENISDHITMTGPDASHMINSLRLRVSDKIIICDGAGADYTAEITGISKAEAQLALISKGENTAEPGIDLTLFAALSKSDKMEQVIAKAVELGAVRIVPFISARCVAKYDIKTGEKKVSRWGKIAMEAAKQCGRGIVPEVSGILDFKSAVAAAKDFDTRLFFYENAARHTLRDVLSEKSFKTVCVFTGPEGGFEETEAEEAKKADIRHVSLGPRILRCETAPAAAISAVMFYTNNF